MAEYKVTFTTSQVLPKGLLPEEVDPFPEGDGPTVLLSRTERLPFLPSAGSQVIKEMWQSGPIEEIRVGESETQFLATVPFPLTSYEREEEFLRNFRLLLRSGWSAANGSTEEILRLAKRSG